MLKLSSRSPCEIVCKILRGLMNLIIAQVITACIVIGPNIHFNFWFVMMADFVTSDEFDLFNVSVGVNVDCT